jgi:PLP dependent protein
MNYEERLLEIRERISKACARSGRSADDVTVVAVTKYVGLEETAGLIEAGATDLGENRLQVALPKLERFNPAETGVRWHYIGSLQTNKVRDVIGRFALIHSVDRLSLAKEIDKRARQNGIVVPCLMQVNVSGEESKSGWAPAEVPDALREMRELSGLELRGYMTMAPATSQPEETRPVFRTLRELRDEWLAKDIAPETAIELSMGMSGDFEVAVEEGATLVRLGTILVKP